LSAATGTGERELLFEKDVEADGSFLNYGGITRAYTGHASEEERECAHGRAAFMDEIMKASIDKIFSILKLLAQKKPGEAMHRKVNKKILPGAMLIAATNPPGERHGLPEITPALERKFTKIEVNYPPAEELYEFALACGLKISMAIKTALAGAA